MLESGYPNCLFLSELTILVYYIDIYRERDQTVLTNILSQSHCLACDLSLKKAKRATENGQDYSKNGETEDIHLVMHKSMSQGSESSLIGEHLFSLVSVLYFA